MILLCVLDGFGLREATPDNAIAAAHKPVYDNLIKTCPHTEIDGSGLAVGLPAGQMGNSEVGHLNLGAGRVVYQEISRIDKAIEDGEFFENDIFNSSIERAVAQRKAIHLFGLISDGQVHSSLKHLYALVELAKRKNVRELYLHAFMDGRDTPPTSGKDYMAQVLKKFDEIGLGAVSTVSGRYYGMDRDRRWERTDRAFRAIVLGEGPRYTDPITAINESYSNNLTDEFILPVVIESGNQNDGRVNDGDLCIMFNFRSDRARQLSYLLSGHPVEGHNTPEHPEIELVTMTSYDVHLHKAKSGFQPVALNNILGKVLSSRGLKQLRTAETEKYAHVTFFFNGGVEEPFEGESRDMIASPKVATYDLQPEMSSVEVTDNAVRRIMSGEYDFVLLNYANCDMVGHSGIFEAAQKAVEAVDRGIGRLLEVVHSQKGVALITADHGNAETMIDPQTGGPWTAHTTNPVPFILYDPFEKAGNKLQIKLRDKGILADVAPTVLDILKLEQPEEMTGKSLIVRG
ncbi:MAG: 2,3-bisphosphoglycerate-independent phosphoglycerate mutase [Candidatus Zixiibacteriota bacterium]